MAAAATRKNGVGTLAPVTTRRKIGFVGLLRDGSRHSWIVPNMPNPKQTRNSEIKLGRNQVDPLMDVREIQICGGGSLGAADHGGKPWLIAGEPSLEGLSRGLVAWLG
ncbi:hypothetical protein CRG98_022608 [Punica granatum]|uniref:Uncharacterized protein n=1 Tax=Punica granatum TaxID=22663 RepID=A0A2I0JL52_PUNGR|nr:hypothetical protein CRG98_022608 [Punica granatum]